MPKTTWGAEATWVGQRSRGGIVQIAQVPGNFGTVDTGFKPMALTGAIQPAHTRQPGPTYNPFLPVTYDPFPPVRADPIHLFTYFPPPIPYRRAARQSLRVGGVASGAAIGAITGARVGRNPAGGVTRGPGGRAIGQAEFWAQMGQVAQDPVQRALTAVGGPQAAAGQCVWIEQACCKMMTNGLWRCSWPGGACTPGLETCPPWLTQAIRRLPYTRGQMGAFMGRAPSKRKRSWVARVRRFLGRL